MENIVLNARVRSGGTKGNIKSLRRQGMLPAVVYGREIGNMPIQVPLKEFAGILANHSIGGALINLNISTDDNEGAKTFLVMVREVQRDPLRHELLHADFYQVSLNEEIETEIPIHLVGEAPGLKAGGILQHMLREVTVSCLPADLPEHIDADISRLEIGDQLTVADLKVPPKVKVLSDPDSVIVLVVEPVLDTSSQEEAEEDVEAAETDTE